MSSLTFGRIETLVRCNWDSRSGLVTVAPYGQGLRITHSSGKTADIPIVSKFDLNRTPDAFHTAMIAPALQKLKASLGT